MNWFRLTLGALATWRVTHLLAVEDGPWEVLAKFRRLVAIRFFRGLLDCFYCLSVWVALPIAFVLGGLNAADRILSWLALSAAAILLEDLSTWLVGSAPPVYFEEKGEDSDGLLREDQPDKDIGS